MDPELKRVTQIILDSIKDLESWSVENDDAYLELISELRDNAKRIVNHIKDDQEGDRLAQEEREMEAQSHSLYDYSVADGMAGGEYF